MLYLYLAIGGIIGTLARYAVGGWIQTSLGTGFPWGTLTINLAGSFILGFVVRATEISPISPNARGLLTVGFCGAFTTFSTLTLETVTLAQQAAWGRAAIYAVGSLLLGLVALVLGLSSASALLRTPA